MRDSDCVSAHLHMKSLAYILFTQIKHVSFLSELYTLVNVIFYVCASVLWMCMRASSLHLCASV